jgi:hypothetical protein
MSDKTHIRIPSVEGTTLRKHRSERSSEEQMAALEQARIEVEAEEIKKAKPLKKARSQAELTRVRQGYALVLLSFTNVSLTVLIALKTFGII